MFPRPPISTPTYPLFPYTTLFRSSTRAGRDRHKSIDRTMFHFEDDYHSMMGRIGRLGTKSAWAEDPPSRTRRFVTNIRVAPAAKEGEYEVTSYILLARSRYEHSQ